MAFSQSDIDTLNAAISSGVMRVKFADGREVQYRSTDELIKARNLALSEIAAASGSSSTSVTSFSRE